MVRSQVKAITTTKRGSCLRRLAAWAGVLALALQILLPLAPAQAAVGVDQELAASICHATTADAAPPSSNAAHDHCQFCQIHASAKLVAPTLSWSQPPRSVVPFAIPVPTDDGAVDNPGHPPHPQRGPPTAS